MLDSGEAGIRFAIEVLGKAGDPTFSEMLLEAAGGEDSGLKAWALSGLGKMGHEEATEIASSATEDPSKQVRDAALNVLSTLKERIPMAVWIRLLGHHDPRFRKEASMAIQDRGEEVSHFITQALKRPYRYALYVRELQKIEKGKTLPLLLDHILERNNESLEIILRVLGIMEFGDRMDAILKAIQSGKRAGVRPRPTYSRASWPVSDTLLDKGTICDIFMLI